MLYLCSSANRSILDYPDAIHVRRYATGFGYSKTLCNYTFNIWHCIVALTDEEAVIETLMGTKCRLLPDNANVGVPGIVLTLFPNIPRSIHRSFVCWDASRGVGF